MRCFDGEGVPEWEMGFDLVLFHSLLVRNTHRRSSCQGLVISLFAPTCRLCTERCGQREKFEGTKSAWMM